MREPWLRRKLQPRAPCCKKKPRLSLTKKALLQAWRRRPLQGNANDNAERTAAATPPLTQAAEGKGAEGALPESAVEVEMSQKRKDPSTEAAPSDEKKERKAEDTAPKEPVAPPANAEDTEGQKDTTAKEKHLNRRQKGSEGDRKTITPAKPRQRNHCRKHIRHQPRNQKQLPKKRQPQSQRPKENLKRVQRLKRKGNVMKRAAP